MFNRLVLIAGAAALVAAGSAWSADGFSLKGEPKIAFLYFKAKNDGGWTQAFDEAKPKIEATMKQQIPYVENIAEDAAQITPPAEKFIQRGYNVIVGTAFGYSDTLRSCRPSIRRLPSSMRRAPPTARTYSRSTAGRMRANISAAWWPAPCRNPASSASSAPIRSASSTGPSMPMSSAPKRPIRRRR